MPKILPQVLGLKSRASRRDILLHVIDGPAPDSRGDLILEICPDKGPASFCECCDEERNLHCDWARCSDLGLARWLLPGISRPTPPSAPKWSGMAIGEGTSPLPALSLGRRSLERLSRLFRSGCRCENPIPLPNSKRVVERSSRTKFLLYLPFIPSKHCPRAAAPDPELRCRPALPKTC